jgi:hypothetical protein
MLPSAPALSLRTCTISMARALVWHPVHGQSLAGSPQDRARDFAAAPSHRRGGHEEKAKGITTLVEEGSLSQHVVVAPYQHALTTTVLQTRDKETCEIFRIF